MSCFGSEPADTVHVGSNFATSVFYRFQAKTETQAEIALQPHIITVATTNAAIREYCVSTCAGVRHAMNALAVTGYGEGAVFQPE